MNEATATLGTGARGAGREWSMAAPLAGVSLQLLLATAVVYVYRIEGDRFFPVFVLALIGFVVNAALPLAYRLPFFTAVSIAGTLLVFTPVDAAWLLVVGLVLVGTANLPLSIKARAAILVVMAAGLAAGRAGLTPVPWSASVWPILGSMFMFRLAVYLTATGDEPRPQRLWWSLAYFFMLPNLVFPLYPVVDYQTFRRTYYDREASEIHERGLLWIARGLVHLLLYRIVYHLAVIDPESVATLGDLVQFMIGTFLLYLRVSGQFHLIVGLLHLFGFRLPETHKLYYLAHSFTELWRRINIYWTDFMMKTVFYPTYFAVKRRGPTAALVLSTGAVFITTWVLHSYQWFWLRGGFPLTPQDVLFWGILGGLVIVGGVRESRHGRRPAEAQRFWRARLGLRAAVTFCLFCLLWSLWSIDSAALWVWILGAAANVDAKGVLLTTGTVLVIGFLGGIDWASTERTMPPWFVRLTHPKVRAGASLALLIVLAHPAVRSEAPAPLARVLAAMQTTGLNARDLATQHRGYYEQLDVRAQLDAVAGSEVGRTRTAAWRDLSQLDVLNERRDLMLRDLKPSRQTTWNGHLFSTNRWGMRDAEYDIVKPAGTLRIAILGPSHVMGNNVGDGETFESVVERHLNNDLPAGYDRVEVLNFGVDGFSLPQQVALMEDRVFRFSPDVVIATHYWDNVNMTEAFLLKLVDRQVPVSNPGIARIMTSGGLLPLSTGAVPIPFPWARSLAGRIGVEARMPFGETHSRARRIAEDVVADAFAQFAALTRAHGVAPGILALNVVIDQVPPVPLRDVIERQHLPLFDLFGVFPVDRRPELRVAPWDDHPNAEGHRLVAEAWTPALKSFVESGAIERARSGGSAP